jgi:hypothetical protein
MKIIDSMPRTIYATYPIFYFFDDQGILCKTVSKGPHSLVFVFYNRSGRQNTRAIKFEVIASESQLLTSTYVHFYAKVEEKINPIPLSNLPLYIHYSYKTENFENLLKGKALDLCPRLLFDHYDAFIPASIKPLRNLS